MSGGSHIAAVGSGSEPSGAPLQDARTPSDDVLALQEEWAEPVETAKNRFGWIIPTLAILTIAGWTGFFLFAQGDAILAGGSPQQWIAWVTNWAIPVLLVVAIWLLAMRTSSREAARFGDAARLLADESARLEARLSIVNRELSLAREFIAAQSRDLESLGRVASERLSENANRLAGLIFDNSRQIDSIASVSAIALENMDKLRNDLPVIANSARDVTSQIGNAGRTAQNQLDELVSGFHRLNEFGEASERQVQSLRARVDAALAAFEAQASNLQEIAAKRFAALEEGSSRFRADLDRSEIEALAAIRRRAEALAGELAAGWDDLDAKEDAALQALGSRLAELRKESDTFATALREGESDAIEKWRLAIDEMRARLSEALIEIGEIDSRTLEDTRRRLSSLGKEAKDVDKAMQNRVEIFMSSLEARRDDHKAFEAEQLASLEQRLVDLDFAIAERQKGHVAQIQGLTERGEELVVQLSALGEQLEAFDAQGAQASSGLAQAIDALTAKIEANQARLNETDKAVSDLTDASVRLLELIQASSEHSREQLPKALESARLSLSDFEERTKATGLILEQAGQKSQEVSNYVLAARQDGRAALEEMGALHAQLEQQGRSQAEQFEQLQAILARLSEESEQISARSQGELSQAIAALRENLRSAIEDLDRGSSEAVQKIAEEVGARSAAAIDQALRAKSSEAIGEFEKAVAHATGVSRDAARQLRDQLAKVDELAGNLESRVQRARQQAEEQVDNDFARRVALITESLNSNAIDISKALSNDVTDTAWASYLRGDRGIFTRRAVRLLDNSEAREIAEIYDRDPDFREHVSRYIHDFEAMLRTMLSTRDGNALGVTLLSSDMGKLYVALAQAIERLRG
ncbi:MAG TPA: ATPase [Sphingomonadaceae bacterium]|nr:ATPase [Sphingomonadaceae bacterium]